MRTRSPLPAALAPLLALSLALSACGRDAPVDPADPAGEQAAIAAAHVTEALLQADGLLVADADGGMARTLAFGTPKAEVIARLSQPHERAPRLAENAECGAGPLAFADWGDGLTLAFQTNHFVGWWLDDSAGPGFVTLREIGIGATLPQLRAAYPEVVVGQTSIGTEFTAGDLSGTLSGPGPDATVTALSAGVSCVFR